MRRPAPHIVLAGVCTLVLAGCTGGSLIGVLDEEQQGQDVLTIQTDLDGIDLATTRLLAERDGVEYFVARPEAGAEAGGGAADTVCLLVEEGIGVGLECGPLERGAAGPTIRDSRVTVVLLPDDIDRNDLADQGFELLHPNLAIRPAGAE
ncbi:hypothetical protein FQ377_07600 [Arthrobacter echini]|uniref:Lipoprotein n=1 Tax=Arthrobacter echini TaxID=1529066 RepID=A0A5D0XSS8_9MICC|nr:hypothetical protein [Arthrobacter echini]TYC98872.1 hypothetical protein FQ377_07600 [Arthrobacter echini]